MNLCSDDHDEICYIGRTCPVCELKTDKDDEIKRLEAIIRVLKVDLESTEECLKSTKERLKSAKEGLLLLKGEETQEDIE